MNATQLLERIKTGEITIDTLGHTLEEDILKNTTHYLEGVIQVAQGSPDNGYAQLKAKDPDYYTPNSKYCLCSITATCPHCGTYLTAHLKDENTISFIRYEHNVGKTRIFPCESCKKTTIWKLTPIS